jgi:hypothetical protein
MSYNIKLTKEYCKNGFLPTDLQWPVEEVADDFTLYDLFCLVNHAEIMDSVEEAKQHYKENFDETID